MATVDCTKQATRISECIHTHPALPIHLIHLGQYIHMHTTHLIQLQQCTHILFTHHIKVIYALHTSMYHVITWSHWAWKWLCWFRISLWKLWLVITTEDQTWCCCRMLCCTTDLTVHPSGVLPLLCCYYLLIFPFSPFNYRLVSYLLHCTRLCPIVMLFLSPPPPPFSLFFLFNKLFYFLSKLCNV